MSKGITDTPTDFQCPVCGTFYENAQKLLDHFNEFPDKDDQPHTFGLKKMFVCMCYNISRLGYTRQVVADTKSFEHIKYYSEHPEKK